MTKEELQKIIDQFDESGAKTRWHFWDFAIWRLY